MSAVTLKVCPDEFPNRFCGKTDEIEEGIILRWIVLFLYIDMARKIVSYSCQKTLRKDARLSV